MAQAGQAVSEMADGSVDDHNDDTDSEGDTDSGDKEETSDSEECAAQGVSDLSGLPESQVEEILDESGFVKKPKKTVGGYQEWKHPDGSIINVRPDGEISRAGPKKPPSGGSGNERWFRPGYDPSGAEIPFNPGGGNTHSTGERIKKR